jgi:hypothetical protein
MNLQPSKKRKMNQWKSGKRKTVGRKELKKEYDDIT